VTSAQRREIEEGLARSTARVARLFDRHPVEEITRRPSPTSWSTAECVAHLTLTAAAAVPLLETALAELRERGGTTHAPSRMDWLGRLLRWSLEPPPRLKTRTAAPFVPVDVEPLERVRPAFEEQQARLVRILGEAEGLDLSRARVTSPFDRRIRYNALSMLRILETHERRHLWQAERAVG
jgi:hypothetical protein